MKRGKYTILFYFLFFSFTFAQAEQGGWPKAFKTSTGSEVKLYEPQPQSFSGGVLTIRSAVSLQENGKTDPVFGVLWANISVSEQNDNVLWKEMTLTDVKFPGETSQTELDELTNVIETQIPRLRVEVSRDELNEQLSAAGKEEALAENISTKPPTIIYSKKPAVLVLIDGEPQFEKNTSWGVDQVVNTPYAIVRKNDQQFYLYGEKKWYTARSLDGPWSLINKVPSSLSKMEKDVLASDTTSVSRTGGGISDIIVSHEPAELIQSDGEPNFTPIAGTDLLYMTNTGNDIFMDVNSQHYYVLISGRWYKAPNLASSWTYIAATDLPKDFARIPENSPKGIVLASVAGTEAASESIAEAQIPQTAKVDRKNANASVTYDGDPQFENIEGTNLRYAVNTNAAVLNEGRTYFYVENGVWFQSNNPNGPWMVSTERPGEVQNIPPSYPVYNVKYVYIYDATPDYVYMGYTPGYLGTYIYGPTIVYGTGYHYRPWRGRHYYARPYTWGFNMRYDPWYGFSFGLNIFPGWFFSGVRYYDRGYYNGCWGPPVYRPPYYSYYNPYRYRRGYNYHSGFYHNNIYRYRRDVVTYNRPVYNTVYNNYYNNGRPGRQSGVQRPPRQGNNPGPVTGVDGQVNRRGAVQRVREERISTPAPRDNVNRNPINGNNGSEAARPQRVTGRVSDERVNGETGSSPVLPGSLPGRQNIPSRSPDQPGMRPNREPAGNNATTVPPRFPQQNERVAPSPNREVNRDAGGRPDIRSQRIQERGSQRENRFDNDAPATRQRSVPERPAASQRVYEPASSNSRRFEAPPSRSERQQTTPSPRSFPSASNERVRSERPSFERSAPAATNNSQRNSEQRPARSRQ